MTMHHIHNVLGFTIQQQTEACAALYPVTLWNAETNTQTMYNKGSKWNEGKED